MSQPMTVVQRAFVDWCIAYSKFRIVDLMSISIIAYDADSYNALARDIVLTEYGFCDMEMIEKGRSLFPDVPGQPEGSGFDAAYDVVRTTLDEWLRGPVMPIDQVSLPPDP
ncbi:hypothetical protein [Burkholderia multivorans]|uniref:hypothetical protein n=1 Tax=Burkholderia multivorans TaxID=87883 RepID=UPI000A9F7FDE|nr:hypothetical protein [Burkholderia multivorans]UQN70556.1 hypothetical protein L0Z45_06685 [Burkholderia multivorans]UQN76288.1 hypothetical protein L0Z11_06665 [Burkholderia multivorans]